MIKNIGIVSASKFVSMLAVLVGWAVLTRQAAIKEDYVLDSWAIYSAAWFLFFPLMSLRLELAVLLPKEETKAAAVWAGGCVSSLVMAFAAWGICGAASKMFFGQYDVSLRGYLPLLAAWLFTAGCFELCMGWFIRKKMFGWYAASRFLVPSLTIGIQIAAVRWLPDDGLYGLIGGAVMVQVVMAAVAVLLVMIRDHRLILANSAGKDIWSVISEYRVYPTYMTALSLVVTARSRVIYFMFGNFPAQSVAGFYYITQRVVTVPVRMICGGLRPVFFQNLANFGFKKAEEKVWISLFLILTTMIPAWSVMVVHAEDIFALAFGKDWRIAGVYGMILSIPVIPSLTSGWLDRGFDVLGRQRLRFCMEAGISCVVLIGNYVGLVLFKDIILAISFQSAFETFYCWAWLWVLFRLGGYSMQYFYKLVALYIVESSGCLLVAWIARENSSWMSAMVLCLFGFYLPSWVLAVVLCLFGFYLPFIVFFVRKRRFFFQYLRKDRSEYCNH